MMEATQILLLALLGPFYPTYIAKMVLLKKPGIRGDLLGKGSRTAYKSCHFRKNI